MAFGGAVDVPVGAVLVADVCIIGAGAAGLTVARGLDGTGVDVLVLEAGGTHRDRDLEASEFSIEALGEPFLNPEPTRGRWYGGSTNLWFGRIAAPSEIDFEQRSWVPHSGWPITRESLIPWMRAAADQLDVPHFDRIDIGSWAANATIDTFRRGRDTDLSVFLWADKPDVGKELRPQLERSSNVQVLLDATVTSIVPNDAVTAVDEVVVRRADGQCFRVNARTVVLASGGFENPRLLLASTTRTPNGLGNDHDLVGRFYMDHPRGEGHAELDLRGCDPAQIARVQFLGERTASELGDVQLGVTFAAETQRREHLLNHAVQAHLVSDVQASEGFRAAKRLVQRARNRAGDLGPVSADVRAVLRGSPDLMRFAAQRLMRRVRPSSAVFIDQMEQEPDPDSRVTVDHRQRDRFGLPQLQVDWRIGASTRHSQVIMHGKLRDVLGEFGMTGFRSRLLDDPSDPPDLWDMKHPSGTTRMSTGPATGVVDTDGRVHGVANLYVCGSSVFPTVGHANPTLLIVALAARLADHLRSKGPT